MIQIVKIIKDKDQVINDLKKRNIDFTKEINTAYDKALKKRKLNQDLDKKRGEFNALNKKNRIEDRDRCLEIKEEVKNIEDEIVLIDKEILDILICIPNIPHNDVPNGKGYEENLIIKEKNYHNLEFDPVPHWEICNNKKIIDFDLGNKITERGFPVYIGDGAKMQRAIINFCLEEAENFGFKEYGVPILVNKETVFRTGQYPDKENQMYHIEKDDLYLIPTAEVPLTNVWRDEILNIQNLPILAAAYTPCFRREAGAHGKDNRGLNRLHQFDKIELVCITTQEDGYERLEIMRNYIEGLLDKLKLTYRVLALCGGELGFGAAKAYDIEIWCPGQKKWVEVVTVTNFDTFQANRLNCKYIDGKEKKLVHTLNGTGLALPRIIIGILETYQTKDGNITIPDCLLPWLKFKEIK